MPEAPLGPSEAAACAPHLPFQCFRPSTPPTAINIAVGLLVGYSVGRFVAPGPSLGVFVATIALGNYGNLSLGMAAAPPPLPCCFWFICLMLFFVHFPHGRVIFFTRSELSFISGIAIIILWACNQPCSLLLLSLLFFQFFPSQCSFQRCAQTLTAPYPMFQTARSEVCCIFLHSRPLSFWNFPGNARKGVPGSLLFLLEDHRGVQGQASLLAVGFRHEAPENLGKCLQTAQFLGG